MRKNRTRKGPPPQRNQALIQAMREAAAQASRTPQPPIETTVEEITDVAITPGEQADAEGES